MEAAASQAPVVKKAATGVAYTRSDRPKGGTMARDTELDIRAEVVELLLDIVTRDRNPSVTMLDMIEYLATPEERGRYARVLMAKVESSRHPSIPMLKRLVALG
jgi:hypothetical protein